MRRTVIFGLLFAACTLRPDATTKAPYRSSITLCALISERDKMDGKEVVVEAVFQQTPHGMILFSERCKDSFTHLEWRRADYASEDVARVRNDLLKGNAYRRLSVVVRGVFRIARPYQCLGPNCLRQKIDGIELLRVESQRSTVN